LAETKEKLEKLRSYPEATDELISLVEKDLKTLEYLYENFYLEMNVFRNAKGI